MKKLVLLMTIVSLFSCTKETYVDYQNIQTKAVIESKYGQMVVGYDTDGVPINIEYEISYAPAGEHGLDFDHIHFYGRSKRQHEVSFDIVLEGTDVLYFSGIDAVGFDDIDTECGWCDCMETLFNDTLNSWWGYGYAIVCPECAIGTLGGFAIVCAFAEVVDGGPGSIEG